MTVLEIRDLWASVENKQILRGVDLEIRRGEIHALMGPNGSGKSTLAYVVMGHPKYSVDRGEILLDGESILGLSPDERARRGVFLAFQYPIEVPGITMANFLRRAYLSVKMQGEDPKKLSVAEFQKLLSSNFQLLQMDPSFSRRYLNEGFSGGEKKRGEIVQLAMLRPRVALLDETDSGLDIDSVRIVAESVKRIISDEMSVLLITHYARILNYLRPNYVHVMHEGRVIVSGGYEIAQELEEHGYRYIEEKYAS